MKVALVDKNTLIIQNVIEVDENSQYPVPDGQFLYLGKDIQKGATVTGTSVIPPNIPVLAQITTLENTVTQRRLREAILGYDKGWLANVDAQIINLRKQL